MSSSRAHQEKEAPRRAGTPIQDADSGPGTAQPETPTDETIRTPDSTVVDPKPGVRRGTTAAPLIPPDVKTQLEPVEGQGAHSTNPVQEAAGRLSQAGENHTRFETENGKEITRAEDVFDVQPDRTWVEVKQDVHEVFTYPGQKTPTVRLAYKARQKHPLAEFARLQAALPKARAQAEQGHPAEGTPEARAND
jgi:hypothetical protein